MIQQKAKITGVLSCKRTFGEYVCADTELIESSTSSCDAKSFLWTEEQDEYLTSAVGLYGVDWTKVAERVGCDKTDKECLERYQSLISQFETGKDWTDNEVAVLIEFAKQQKMKLGKYVSKYWFGVETVLPNKTMDECRSIFNYMLSSNDVRVADFLQSSRARLSSKTIKDWTWESVTLQLSEVAQSCSIEHLADYPAAQFKKSNDNIEQLQTQNSENNHYSGGWTVAEIKTLKGVIKENCRYRVQNTPLRAIVVDWKTVSLSLPQKSIQQCKNKYTGSRGCRNWGLHEAIKERAEKARSLNATAACVADFEVDEQLQANGESVDSDSDANIVETTTTATAISSTMEDSLSTLNVIKRAVDESSLHQRWNTYQLTQLCQLAVKHQRMVNDEITINWMIIGTAMGRNWNECKMKYQSLDPYVRTNYADWSDTISDAAVNNVATVVDIASAVPRFENQNFNWQDNAPGQIWSQAEFALLEELIRKHHVIRGSYMISVDWETVCASFPDKTVTQCRNKFGSSSIALKAQLRENSTSQSIGSSPSLCNSANISPHESYLQMIQQAECNVSDDDNYFIDESTITPMVEMADVEVDWSTELVELLLDTISRHQAIVDGKTVFYWSEIAVIVGHTKKQCKKKYTVLKRTSTFDVTPKQVSFTSDEDRIIRESVALETKTKETSAIWSKLAIQLNKAKQAIYSHWKMMNEVVVKEDKVRI